METKNFLQNLNYDGIVFTVVSAIIIYVIFSNSGLLNYLLGVDLSFVLLPILLALGLYLLVNIFDSTFEGPITSPLKKILSSLSVLIPVFFLLRTLPGPNWIQSISNSVIIVLPGIVVYSFASYFNQKHPVSTNILKSLTLLFLGFFLRSYLISAIPPDLTILESSAGLFVANTLFFGLIFGAFAAGFGISKNFHSTKFSKIGSWFDSNKIIFFVIGCIIGFYGYNLREFLLSRMSSRLLILEWTGITIFGLLGFLTLIYKVEELSKTTSTDLWREHKQKVEKIRDDERTKINGLIGNFIEGGSKEGLLVYLISRAQDQGISWEGIMKALRPLFEYKDKKIPSLTTFKDKEELKMMNKKRRKEVLEKTIKRLKEEPEWN